MPNVWTHILFVDRLCLDLDQKELIKTSSFTLHMGAQGPDPFFYHNFWPFLKDEKVADVGMKLHTENCGPFLLDMIERGNHLKNHLQAFILGFVSHHILDRNTHPYIHYNAGYEGNKHQELEVLIDTLMLKRERNLNAWQTPVHKEIKAGEHLESIANLLESLIKTHYPDVPERYNRMFIKNSFKHMQAAQCLLYDPWKWKNKWFGNLVSSFSHQPIAQSKDYLNEKKTDWHHPATYKIRNESFLDLYDKALIEGKVLFQYIFRYWRTQDNSDLKKIQDIIGNVSYDTGEPLERQLKNEYSSPIV